MYKLNPDSQKLADIERYGAGRIVRIYMNTGDTFEGYPLFWTYATIGEDEDVDAMAVKANDGTCRVIAGVEIDHFEVLEDQ